MMNGMWKTIFPAIVMLVATAGYVQSEATALAAAPASKNLTQVLDRLQRHYRDTDSFSAKFSEEIATVGAPKRKRQGTVSFRKPGRMRWEFEAPEVQTLVSDGQTLYSYDPDLNQVVETPLKQALKSSSATSFLLGLGNIKRDFKAAFASPAKPGGLIDLMLDPKAGGYKIEVGIDPKTYNLITLTLTDQLGDTTRIDFSDVRDNVDMPDSIFAFRVPAGADVVAAPASP